MMRMIIDGEVMVVLGCTSADFERKWACHSYLYM